MEGLHRPRAVGQLNAVACGHSGAGQGQLAVDLHKTGGDALIGLAAGTALGAGDQLLQPFARLRGRGAIPSRMAGRVAASVFAAGGSALSIWPAAGAGAV